MKRRGGLTIGICSVLLLGILLCVTSTLVAGPAQAQGRGTGLLEHHPALGAWFGKAVESCVGDPATNCAGLGLPALSLFMTPSFYADGNLIVNDSLAIGGAPFGPHTTAHGQWIPTGQNELVADMVFMLPAPVTGSVSAIHIRYSAAVIPPNTMVGYVNIYVSFPPLPLSLEVLGPDDFPTLPSTATDLVISPNNVYTDQNQCTVMGCPLVFKFKVLRVVSSTQ